MLVILLMSQCRWFHLKPGNVYPVGNSIYSTPININKYFRNVLENYLNCTGFHFLMTYTTLPGILGTSSLTLQHLENLKPPKGELKYISPHTSCPASKPATDAFAELEVNTTSY